jgi:predicted transposase/invertase (TIGR01784 family)
LTEKWGVFLAYANHADKGELLERTIESAEGIRMGDEMLRSVSKDRDAFIEYYHRMKAEADAESQIIKAREEGREEGREEERKNTARDMLRDNADIELIMKYSRLSREAIEALSLENPD